VILNAVAFYLLHFRICTACVRF